MEAREILVANTKTQRRYKITTAATTLGELKAAMRENDIDYSGLEFTEGITKTQLLDDASLLPSNIPYKGAVTNNLVILLTNTKKKIDSGYDEEVNSTDRAEAYKIIKDNDMQEEVKEEFGRNFTQVSTAALWEFIHNHELDDEDDICDDETEEDEPATLVDIIMALIEDLYNKRVFVDSDAWDLINLLEEEYPRPDWAKKANPVASTDGKITNDDINKMIDDLHGIQY